MRLYLALAFNGVWLVCQVAIPLVLGLLGH